MGDGGWGCRGARGDGRPRSPVARSATGWRRRRGRRGFGLRKLSEHGAQTAVAGVRGRGEAVGGAETADGHAHHPGGQAGEEELEASDLVPPAAGGREVFALEPELGAARRGGQVRARVDWRGPGAETAWREGRTYLTRKLNRIHDHAGFDRLHPARGARGAQARGRSLRRRALATTTRRRVFQDPR